MNTLSIIDVGEFLIKITIEYQRFGVLANALIIDLPELDPAGILDRCTRLGRERQRLAQLDEQLIDIMNLAGGELVYSAHIANYRKAFASACQAVDTIHQQLLSIREHCVANIQH